MVQEVSLSALEAALRSAGEMVCRPGRELPISVGCGTTPCETGCRDGFLVAGAVSDLTGRPPSAFTSLADLIATLHADDRAGFGSWCRADHPTSPHVRGIVRLRQPDGRMLRCEADIAAVSPFGNGRVIVLRRVPIRTRYEASSVAHRAHRQIDARRLLLADDSIQTLTALQTLLTRRGYRVRVATNGLAALQIAREFEPHAAVLDIGMPGATGLEVAVALRRQFGDRPLTLIALSGYSQRDDRARAAAAGFDHHLQKPANIAAIIALLAEA